MELTEVLKQVQRVCLNHFEELTQTEELPVFRINISSQTIWGGNGDRDEDLVILLTKDGWVERNIESDTGLYQKGDGIRSCSDRPMTEERLVVLAHKHEDIAALERLIKFVDRIKEQYPDEFRNA